MVIDIDQYPAHPKHNFEDFFKNFEDSPNHFKYREEIQGAALRKKTYIYVLFEDILSYDPPLAELLREAPEETLREGIDALKDLLKFYAGGKIDEDLDYFVRIKTDNNSNEENLRKLRAVHIDKLVYIYGILIRASQIIPQITIAYFECPVCQQVTKVDQIEDVLIAPKQCSNCKNKSGFMVTSKDSTFIDWQSIRVQELPEELSPGRVPYSIKGILTHDLVDKARPGDRVKITGIFKTFVNENSRGKKSTLFTPYLRILSIEGKNAEEEDLNISPEDEKEYRRLAAKPSIQELIAKSVAPSILGLDHLKMAAALSLFGGVRKEFKDGSARRGDIHVLFIGDPGTGKSQILKQCAHISPQAIYVSGKGSSAAGLTAAVVRENDASGLSLEAGVLVLADGGNAIIDEFDKMDNRDRVAIHEAMEQQTVSVAKAGIIATLRARTSIIAAANPKMGRYSEYNTPTDNINLSPPILSRFDLIFVVKDEPNPTLDQEMADFILDLNTQESVTVTGPNKEPLIPSMVLQKYIKYARSKIFPKLTPEARKIIRDFYIDLRKADRNDESAAIAVVARHLEGYIRISEAYAKMALRNYVTEKDAENALELAKRSLKDTSTDPNTGKLDVDRVLTGLPAVTAQITGFLDAIKHKIDANKGDAINEQEFIDDMEFSKNIERGRIERLLEKLKNDGIIFSPIPGTINLTPVTDKNKKGFQKQKK